MSFFYESFIDLSTLEDGAGRGRVSNERWGDPRWSLFGIVLVSLRVFIGREPTPEARAVLAKRKKTIIVTIN